MAFAFDKPVLDVDRKAEAPPPYQEALDRIKGDRMEPDPNKITGGPLM